MDMLSHNQFILWLLPFLSYLIGSIPFGLIFTHFAGLGDVRSIGSGNIGATNVLRTGNKKIAFLTLLCDLLKGTVAVIFASMIVQRTDHYSIILLSGFCVFLGHLYPVWLKFKGGKGVATYLGVCLGFYGPLALIFVIVWVGIAFITRYSSLSALIAVVTAPIFTFFILPNNHRFSTALILAIMSMIVIVKHHENINRLLKGEEDKISKKG
ncbi:glycerol-3-phosphate 1-O-acyltransferase PlsY [Bartonella tamiae]|uniref:Glycerol-3-phosphate acyltransferase n=1 Tax=Bartonella tamiae Th239 TaxID=1094558 RepID=J1JVZ9_9HYPH|nr:glycerol-3-phosphate 1-O-acyltransferase PlsY [Bartonella tamiae]EJF88755.1 acyl-phosphate glycerol 3-phosphate acyltransferase [Bartonella tamiae Th239]EJF94995.1 acyl-phosphate glycerol 3-phosphate acyltransferase [Bartonella tamiae Th307]